MDLEAKLGKLRDALAGMRSVLVAFSGGVDSTLLAYAANEALGEKALAVTASSETFPSYERAEAIRLGERLGLRHRVVETAELDVPEFAHNPPDRCYHCKRELFGVLKKLAADEGIEWVADGTNADDLADYRPGRRALEELGVRSPLLEAGLGKREVRDLSRRFDLPTWSKPACACLASRFPYGEQIDRAKLQRVDQAERLLRGLGFELVRVRSHADAARIEVAPDQIERLLAERSRVVEGLKRAGFTYVALDLDGYRTGSMNEGLPGRPRGGAE